MRGCLVSGRIRKCWAAETTMVGPRLGRTAVPEGSELLIDQIVMAVRAGDDPAIRGLLARLAWVADVAVLLRLRQRLYEDVPG